MTDTQKNCPDTKYLHSNIILLISIYPIFLSLLLFILIRTLNLMYFTKTDPSISMIAMAIAADVSEQ